MTILDVCRKPTVRRCAGGRRTGGERRLLGGGTDRLCQLLVGPCRFMALPLDVPSWVESDDVEVWLVAGPGRGHVADLAEAESVASTHARRGAVLAANAVADDAERVTQLMWCGYRRVFSMVELGRDTTPVPTTPAPGSIAAVRFSDADEMHGLTTVVWAGRRFFSMPTLESYCRWVQGADPRLMLLAWQDATLIGYVAAREDATGVEVVDVQVHPSHRRLGVATALLARVVEEAERRNCARVWLETEGDDPVGARRFYEKLGFRLAVEHLRFRKPAHFTSD